MPADNESIRKILTVTLLLCLACSVLVSAAAIGLKHKQRENALADMRANILRAAGLHRADAPLETLFAAVEERTLRLEDGRLLASGAPAPDAGALPLSSAQDIARVKTRPRHVRVYLTRRDGRVDKVVLPVSGYGLWSTLRGFLALEADGARVYGLRFYEHKETPGLGGEVDNPAWQALWRGRRLFGEDGRPRLKVVKGRVAPNDPDAAYKIDGLAGATLTGRGVSNMMKFWTGELGYGPFLARLGAGERPWDAPAQSTAGGEQP